MMRGRLCPAGIIATAFLAGAATALSAEPGFQPIDVSVRQIDRFLPGAEEQRFGPLVFRGGLELTSSDRRFGSLSGLDIAADGTLYAVSDTGRWFAATPVMRGGWVSGLEGARIAPILNHAGHPLSGKQWGDAESLRIVEADGGRTALVAFEQVNDLRAFDGHDFAARGSRPVDLPASARAINRNGGLEALAVAPADGPLAGAAVLIAEHSLDGNGNHRGWIVSGPKAGAFSLSRSDGYDVTDAVFLPGGDLLVLERRLQLPLGLGMRIRRVPAGAIVPGTTVDGEVLIEGDLRHQIDNMEGIAVTADEAGTTLIALVSDNNNNALQRTLLLFFALDD